MFVVVVDVYKVIIVAGIFARDYCELIGMFTEISMLQNIELQYKVSGQAVIIWNPFDVVDDVNVVVTVVAVVVVFAVGYSEVISTYSVRSK